MDMDEYKSEANYSSFLGILDNPKFLIVEDQSTMAELLKEVIEAGGASAEIAHDGNAGMEAVSTYDPDVVIADLKMPLLRGDEMLIELRNMGFEKPIIILTAEGNLEAAARAARYNAFDFLSKPVPTPLLIAVLQKALRAEYQRLLLEELKKQFIKSLSELKGVNAEEIESEFMEKAEQEVQNKRS